MAEYLGKDALGADCKMDYDSNGVYREWYKSGSAWIPLPTKEEKLKKRTEFWGTDNEKKSSSNNNNNNCSSQWDAIYEAQRVEEERKRKRSQIFQTIAGMTTIGLLAKANKIEQENKRKLQEIEQIKQDKERRKQEEQRRLIEQERLDQEKAYNEYKSEYNNAMKCGQAQAYDEMFYILNKLYIEDIERRYPDTAFEISENLGRCYLEAWGVEQNFAEAEKYWKHGSEIGKLGCTYFLGLGYECGYFGEVELEKALLYYTKAKDQGYKADKISESIRRVLDYLGEKDG